MAEPTTAAEASSWIKLADEAYSLATKVAGDYGRSVVIEVNNLTDETFRTEWDGDGHSSGKFIKPPPLEVPARTTVLFTSGNTGLTGAVGNIRLVSRDVWLGMSWHNPAVGSNEFRSSENGPRGGEFETRATAGGGEKAAAFQYIIYYRDPQRFHQLVQKLQKPGSGPTTVRDSWYARSQKTIARVFPGTETAAVSWGPNRIDVFHTAVGNANGVGHTWWDGAWRTEVVGLGRNQVHGVAAASRRPDRLDVFYKSDGQLWYIVWDGSRWQPDQNLGGKLGKGGPTAISWGPDRLDVFYRGPDNQLVQRYHAGGKWSGEARLGGALAGKPAVASWASNRLDVFFRGTDNQLHQIWWDGSHWRSARLSGTMDGDPAAVSWGPDRVDVFYPGPGGRFIQRYYEKGEWTGELDLGARPRNSLGLSAASWAPNRLDLVQSGWEGPRSVLWHHWYHG